MALDTETVSKALAYLLIANVNSQNRDPIGAEGNQRLVKLFFALLEAVGTPAVFCDIGANDGATGATAKRLFPQARVFSLEANPHIHYMHANRLTGLGVESMHLAIDSSEGFVSVFIPRTLSRAYVGGEIVPAVISEPPETGKASLLKRDERATYEEVRVPSTTLDALLQPLLHPEPKRDIALWIDVEGAASRVLAGARRTLEQTSVIFLEVEGFQFWEGQALSGEVTTSLIENGFLPISRDREYSDKQFNVIFVHSSLVSIALPKLFKLDGLPGRAAASPGPDHKPQPDARKPEAAKTPAMLPARSLHAGVASSIPVYVPTFNNPTFTACMLEQLEKWRLRNITVVDNGSTYDGMLGLLDRVEKQHSVVRLGRNAGPQSLVTDAMNFQCLPELFCITDPDLLFHPEMPQDFLLTLLDLTSRFAIGKAGLALDIDEKHLFRPEKMQMNGAGFHIWEWEAQFWSEIAAHLGDGSPVYRAHIDTTFALYNKKYFKVENFYSALRVAGRYTCRHLPWYRQDFLPVEEAAFYRANQRFSYYMRAEEPFSAMS